MLRCEDRWMFVKTVKRSAADNHVLILFRVNQTSFVFCFHCDCSFTAFWVTKNCTKRSCKDQHARKVLHLLMCETNDCCSGARLGAPPCPILSASSMKGFFCSTQSLPQSTSFLRGIWLDQDDCTSLGWTEKQVQPSIQGRWRSKRVTGWMTTIGLHRRISLMLQTPGLI